MKTPRSFWLLRLACFALLCATLLRAQPVLAPVAAGSGSANPATPSAGRDNAAGKSLFESGQDANLPLAKWGPVAVRPHLLYRVLRADGLLNPQQNEDASSTVQTASPGVLLEIGEAWTFDYTYSRISHSNHVFKDEVEHGASLAGAYKGRDWSVSLVQRYANSSPTLVETAAQTPQETYMTDVHVARRIGQRTQLSTTAAFSSRQVNEVSANPQWTTSDWRSWNVIQYLEYEAGARLNLAVGFGVGYDRVTPGADMSHTEPQARLSWRPADKVALAVQAGLESRRFEGGRGGSIENPVYRATLHYAPFSTTKLTLSGNRAFSASYFANWATRSRGWTGGLEQRLLKRLYLNADYSDQTTAYVFTSSGAYLDRHDGVRTLSVRLSTTILRAGAVSLIYQHGRNRSSERGFSFVSEQIGTELTYRF